MPSNCLILNLASWSSAYDSLFDDCSQAAMRKAGYHLHTSGFSIGELYSGRLGESPYSLIWFPNILADQYWPMVAVTPIDAVDLLSKARSFTLIEAAYAAFVDEKDQNDVDKNIKKLVNALTGKR